MTEEFIQLTLDWCYSCWRAEPIPPSGAYLCCFECGHVYETPEHLEGAILAQWIVHMGGYGESLPVINADEITFCPLCLHDF